jgi:hypothetical protein
MNYDNETLLKSGIYAIVNLSSERMYIGQTGSTFKRRWALHRGELGRGSHSCRQLQWDWTFGSAAAFEFRILETIPRRYGDYALHREAVYMYQAVNLYNVQMPAARRLDASSLIDSKYSRLPPNAILT